MEGRHRKEFVRYSSQGINITNPPTPRELQVLVLVAKGLVHKRVAYELGISPQTIKNHVSRLIQHFEVDTMLGVLHAIGWTRIPPELEGSNEPVSGSNSESYRPGRDQGPEYRALGGY